MKHLRKQYSDNFLRWSRYFSRSTGGAAFNRIGLQQFFLFESQGIKPSKPNDYFLRLCEGRSKFNALQKIIRDSYGTTEWQGWYADFISMPHWLFSALYGFLPKENFIKKLKLPFEFVPEDSCRWFVAVDSMQ